MLENQNHGDVKRTVHHKQSAEASRLTDASQLGYPVLPRQPHDVCACASSLSRIHAPGVPMGSLTFTSSAPAHRHGTGTRAYVEVDVGADDKVRQSRSVDVLVDVRPQIGDATPEDDVQERVLPEPVTLYNLPRACRQPLDVERLQDTAGSTMPEEVS